MIATLHRQTSARNSIVRGRLPVKAAVLSPFSRRDFMKEVGTGRDTNISTSMATTKAVYGLDYVAIIGGDSYVGVGFFDLTTSPATCTDVQNLRIDMGDATGTSALSGAAISAINTYATSQGYTLSNGIWPVFNSTDAIIAPSSYQTIVTQTGTSAPAVSGSLVPTSTYPSGTTFTWARTSAGVYTLTASTAVFNTSGKTGVFVGGLNNLNASYKAVVTSSTVITLTTAIGSLLGLGLLGLTATPTDALLTQTMVYVQTYA